MKRFGSSPEGHKPRMGAGTRAAGALSLMLAILGFGGAFPVAQPLAASARQAHDGRPLSGEARRVLQATEDFFAAMRTGNADRAAELLSPDGMLFLQRRRADGTYLLVHKSNSTWLEEFRTYTGHMDDTPSRSRVQVWGPVATISQHFVFRRNGRVAHCGVNLFQLVRVGGDWRIANIVWTEEHQGCA